ERLPFLKGVFASIDDPLSAQALIEPPAEVPATNMLSTVVIVPHADPSVSVEDYDNPDSTDVVPENVILGLESKGNRPPRELPAKVNKARGAMIHWESIIEESTLKIWGLITLWGQLL
ncbi:hypothetical protein Tco_0937852, partial [Tanacetum coccineum]